MSPKTEAELCDALAVAARRDGWDVYPEVCGWDLLLVWNGTAKVERWEHAPAVEPGYQIAVEAKLRGNCDVLEEAVSRASYHGPDEVAVFVPKAGRGFRELASRFGLRVLTLESCKGGDWGRIRASRYAERPRAYFPRAKGKRLPLPAVPLQSSGGQPAPRTMSKWRVGALRICIALRARGYVTGADFRAQSISSGRWIAARWLTRDGSDGRFARYIAGPRLTETGPEVGYEAERDALARHDAEAA